MKVLGISFGRKMRCSEIMVKEALFKAKDAGADVEFISTIDMDIQHCKGCGACSSARDKGKQVHCIIKDDYAELEEKVLDADGIIIAAPVYAVGIVGQFKNFVDRFGPAHDRAALLEEQKKRVAAGKSGDELLDPRYFKDRYTAYISTGGAITQNWVALGLPMLQLFGFSLNMKCIGQLDAYDQGRRTSPVLDDMLMKQCGELGTHLAECLGKPYEETDWYGEDGVCPVCHCSLITIKGSTAVECPVCGIKGRLSVQGDKVSVQFSEHEQKRSRASLAGLYEHYNEIQGMIPINIEKQVKYKDILASRLEKYKNFDKLTAD
jgi:ferredoxin